MTQKINKINTRKVDPWMLDCLNYCSIKNTKVSSTHAQKYRDRYTTAIYKQDSMEYYFLKEHIFQNLKCNVQFFTTLQKIIQRDPGVEKKIDKLISDMPMPRISETKPASAYDIFIIPDNKDKSLRNLTIYKGTLYTDEEIEQRSTDAKKEYDAGFDDWIQDADKNNLQAKHFTKYKKYYIAAITNPDSKEGKELRKVNKDDLIRKMMDRDGHTIERLQVVLKHHNLTKLPSQFGIFFENGFLDRVTLEAYIENKRTPEPEPKPEPKPKPERKQAPKPPESSMQHFRNVMMSNSDIDIAQFKKSIQYVVDFLLVGADLKVKNAFIDCMVKKHVNNKNRLVKCMCFHPDIVEQQILRKQELNLTPEEIQQHKQIFASLSSRIAESKGGASKKKKKYKKKLKPTNAGYSTS